MVSKDGKWVVIGDQGGNLFLWDVNKGSLIHQWGMPSPRPQLSSRKEGIEIHAAIFLPDGKTIISGGGKSIRVWDLISAKLVKEIPVFSKGDVRALALSPDGKTVAVGGGWVHGEIRLLEATKLGIIRSWVGENEVKCLQYSPDGKILVAGEAKGIIQIFDPKMEKQEGRFASKSFSVDGIAFAPDGYEMASVGGDCTIHLWDLRRMQEIKLSAGHTDNVQQVMFSHGGEFLASGSLDQSARVWSLKDSRKEPVVIDHPKGAGVMGIAFSPDDKELVSGAGDGIIRVWDWRKGLEVREMGPVGGTLGGSIALAPDGRTVALCNQAGVLIVYEVRTGRLIKNEKAHIGAANCGLEFSRDGTMLASVGLDGVAKIWNTRNWSEIGALAPKERSGRPLTPRFSPDGQSLAFGWKAQAIGLVGIKDKREQLRRIKAGELLDCIAYSPNGRMLAIGTEQGNIVFKGLINGDKLGRLPRSRAAITSLAFSPDGKKLAAGLRDSTVIVWDVTAFNGLAEKKP